MILFAAGSTVRVDRYEPLQPGGDPRVRRAPSAEELRPGVEAAFRSESYPPGTLAVLRFFADTEDVRLQVFHVGPEHVRTVGPSEMRGVPVSRELTIGDASAGRTIRVAVGPWPSGLYFARLDAADGRVGFAPFVVGPRRLGTNRVAVVLPTFTWQAYNIRDDDGDGVGNSWYANRFDNVVRLERPFLNRGVPFRFSQYDLRFLHWLARHDKHVDFLTDGSLDRVRSAAALARAYDLVVFPGHDDTSPSTSTTSSRGIEISAAASRSSRRTTSTGASCDEGTCWRGRGRGGTSAGRSGPHRCPVPGEHAEIRPLRRGRRRISAVALRRHRARERGSVGHGGSRSTPSTRARQRT